AAKKAREEAQAKENGEQPASAENDERAKRIAEAKAKAAAAKKAREEAQAKENGEQPASAENDERAKRIAEAKAKAAAVAKARGETGAERARPDRPRRSREEAAEPKELPPSPLQPLLDKYVEILKKELGDECLEEAYINRLSKDVPTLVAKRETYFRIAESLYKHPELDFNFLSELHGTDFETHMEVYLHLFSFKHKHSAALKVKLNRDNPEIESVTPLWAGANWPECETYDLLGIRFSGHPKLHRIFLGEDWVGHPLRKDYEPYDVEV
ncbi:NADH-quinone oxidoreductase subunit C, partial [Bacillus oleivorans]